MLLLNSTLKRWFPFPFLLHHHWTYNGIAILQYSSEDASSRKSSTEARFQLASVAQIWAHQDW